jgi:hypothetical protein
MRSGKKPSKRTSAAAGKLLAGGLAVAVLALQASDAARAADDPNGQSVTAAGSFQSELGCPGDWQADCALSRLEDADGDGIYSRQVTLPAGDYEALAAIDQGWSQSYGQGGLPSGPNIPFSVPADGTAVAFSFNPSSGVLRISIVGQDIVINEIMNNPAAVADGSGEWFELYNPTGADIDINGWTIGDLDIDSHVIANGGPLLVPAGGYLVLANNADPATNGGVPVDYAYPAGFFLSNGADEVVLLDPAGAEVDRVEYDGGPAFPDPNGASMALADPALDNNIGANWCTSSTPFGAGDLGTPGAANDCDPPGEPPVVVINEIMNNPSAVADSAGEWFELYNPTGFDIDVNGWTIADLDFNSHVIANGGPLLVPAGGYLVLANNADPGSNGGVTVDYTYPADFFLSNSADELVLLDPGGAEMDRVEYDGGPAFPDPTGASMALADAALDNNVGANWCTSSTPFGAGDLGTPGAANDCPPQQEPPVIVINEIMNNPTVVADSAGEWFELYNPTGFDIDIDGWTIADLDFNSHVIANGGPLLVPAGGYLVLANNADPGSNGGVTVDYTYPADFFLSNSADELVLLDPGGAEMDRVEYDGGPAFPDPFGASMALLDPALDNNIGANWCTSTTPFGDGDLGTPGAANNCDAVVARTCDANSDGIIDRSDIRLILSARGQPAIGPNDPRDFDGNGVIDRLDASMCSRNMD